MYKGKVSLYKLNESAQKKIIFILGEEDIVKSLVKNNVKDVTIIPILMLPGNHIKKDIFGSENSWKYFLENEGIAVKSVEKTLLEYNEIREYYIHKIERDLFKR